uniref:Putative glycerol-3-phosphate dehydrogenase, mitochondrial n=1 Tax=Talaromyces marneffei PM1 TaxID=1077442 RepID=A0A093V9L6_TALMA
MANSGTGRSSDTTAETLDKTVTPPDNKHDSENPFIAFRRYADEQISSMLQAVMGLPSTSVPPFSDKWPYFQNKDNNGRDADRESDYRTDDHRPSRRWGFHRDEDFFDRWHNHRHFSDRGFHSLFDGFPMSLGSFLFPESMLSNGDAQTWPLAYLIFSPYSPLYLERSQGHGRRHEGAFSSLFSLRKSEELDPNEPRWRDAFEDLLRVTNGQEMLDRNTESERSRQSADRWLKGLVQRGSLGNNWRLLGSEDSQRGIALERFQEPDHDRRGQDPPRQLEDSHNERTESNDVGTELDLYERFLDDIVNAHERYSRAFADSPLMRLLDEEHGNKSLLASQTTTDDNPTEESRIVSTMTRSVRRTLADGSISTKTVKTKRFADGREESDESVEVTPPPPSEKHTEQNRDSDNGKDSYGGWFWTR